MAEVGVACAMAAGGEPTLSAAACVSNQLMTFPSSRLYRLYGRYNGAGTSGCRNWHRTQHGESVPFRSSAQSTEFC